MRRLFFFIIPIAACLTGCSSLFYTSLQSTDADEETDQVFYDELSPYGHWINDPEYGYVWQPDAGADFRPYDTNGSWVYSDDYGWTWDSGYSWGWAPFHYGRWFYDDYYGWLWAPGNEWAPAWVIWGQSGDYYAWAPMPPGVNSDTGWMPDNGDWNYVPAYSFTNPDINRYVVRNNFTVINRITIINNRASSGWGYRFGRGPAVNNVERFIHRPVQHIRITNAARPGRFRSGDQLNIYRPAIRQNHEGERFAPARVINNNRGRDGRDSQHDDNRGQQNNQFDNQNRRGNQGSPVNKPDDNQSGRKPDNQQGNGQDQRGGNKSNHSNSDRSNNTNSGSKVGVRILQPNNGNTQRDDRQQQPINNSAPQNGSQGYRTGNLPDNRTDSGNKGKGTDVNTKQVSGQPQRPVMIQNSNRPNMNRPETVQPANNNQRLPNRPAINRNTKNGKDTPQKQKNNKPDNKRSGGRTDKKDTNPNKKS